MFRSHRQGWVGVDRGAESVKVARLRRVRGELRVALAAVTPRWTHGEDAALGEKQRVRRELDSIRALAGSWGGRQAAATASMHLCTLAASDDEKADSTSTDCSDSWQGGEKNRYTLSMPTEEVNSLCEGLRLAGLQCRVIDGAPLALARALRFAPEARVDQLVAGLDWGAAGATLVAVKNGRAVYARKLKDCGFRSVLDSVATTLGLATAEAETLVRRHGVATARGEGVASTVADALGHATSSLLVEARRTLSHLGAKLKTKGPERLWGFGVGATPPGLMERIGDRLELSAASWRPEAVSVEDSTDAPACLFGQAIALSTLAWEA